MTLKVKSGGVSTSLYGKTLKKAADTASKDVDST